jgi:hypothetical protein
MLMTVVMSTWLFFSTVDIRLSIAADTSACPSLLAFIRELANLLSVLFCSWMLCGQACEEIYHTNTVQALPCDLSRVELKGGRASINRSLCLRAK